MIDWLLINWIVMLNEIPTGKRAICAWKPHPIWTIKLKAHILNMKIHEVVVIISQILTLIINKINFC